MVLTRVMRSSTSWAKSLSPVDINTSMPCSRACTASVPITSSASTPVTRRIGKPSAPTMRSIGSTWDRRSSGMEGRLALYCGYISSRKVGPGASATKARYSGAAFSVARSMFTTPNSAPVGSPWALVSGGSAWKAR